ncbi:hypothetical protein OE88DRAFT_1127666 [Heliocybe sulcata]|uniref:Uncharacterized protein n=1 Tax=Heliocybe sulcata TaxID=5364 RepID=A0A5C3NJV5_9AGAM|nr:hypothetical protein OE88DRAFT_1127666 [Heliocybe sulcata]
MPTLNWNQQSMVYLFVTSLLYGAYTMIFGACMYALIFRQEASPLRRRLLLVTTALFLLCTVWMILTFWGGFITTDLNPDGSTRGDPTLVNNALLLSLAGLILDAITPVSFLISDGLLIWRCFVLWNRRLLVILSSVIFAATATACGIAMVVFDAKIYWIAAHAAAGSGNEGPPQYKLNSQYNAASAGLYISSCITNVVTSGLIALRIWRATRDIGKRNSRYLRTAWLVLESGALYSVCLLMLAILCLLQKSTDTGALALAYNVVDAITQQIVGIIPTVIILLVSLRETSDQTIEYSDRPNSAFMRKGQLAPIRFARPPARAHVTDANGERHTIELQTRSIFIT